MKYGLLILILSGSAVLAQPASISPSGPPEDLTQQAPQPPTKDELLIQSHMQMGQLNVQIGQLQQGIARLEIQSLNTMREWDQTQDELQDEEDNVK